MFVDTVVKTTEPQFAEAETRDQARLDGQSNFETAERKLFVSEDLAIGCSLTRCLSFWYRKLVLNKDVDYIFFVEDIFEGFKLVTDLLAVKSTDCTN